MGPNCVGNFTQPLFTEVTSNSGDVVPVETRPWSVFMFLHNLIKPLTRFETHSVNCKLERLYNYWRIQTSFCINSTVLHT